MAAVDATEAVPNTEAAAAPIQDAKSKKENDHMNDGQDEETATVRLIPREVFFGNPDKVRPDISPDGRQLAFLAPRDGVLNIWVAPIDNVSAARPITNDKHRGVRSFFWAYDSKRVLYSQDVDGDENWRIFCVDLETDKIRDLTPDPETAKGTDADPTGRARFRAEIQAVSHRFPEEILIGLNDRDPRYHDVYRLNILTGEKELVQKNPGYRGFVTDEDYTFRFTSKYLDDGSLAYYQPPEDGAPNTSIDWQPFLTIPKDDTPTTRFLGFDKSGGTLYMADSRDRDTSALVAMNLETGQQKLIAADPRSDVGAIKAHPTENTIQIVSFYYDRRERKFFDAEVEADFKLAGEGAQDDVGISSWSLDDRHWIIVHLQDDGPVRYFHFDRETKKRTFLFTSRPALEGLPLAKMHSVVIAAHDDLKLVSYLTLPSGSDPDGDGRPNKPLPMVLSVHGGPWARDVWGYDPLHQLMANRGYAVLSVNFRGSTGFGKRFQNIAKRQWAGTMHDDLVTAVKWAADQGIAEKDKVAIMGGSYGGYAALVGLTFTPDVFACGVDIVGPSSLITLIESIPPYWESFRQQLIERVGDISTPEGREELKKRSPLYHAHKITRPLLIAQGKNDPRVKQQEAEQMVRAMEENGISVTYVLFPDEGHGLARPENRLAFYAVTEHFLAAHLGGRAEPIGSAFEGSSLTIPNGAEQIPGLADQL
jgi:dipeptidyl aminopeptidase/acylaminoacyl peptidase